MNCLKLYKFITYRAGWERTEYRSVSASQAHESEQLRTSSIDETYDLEGDVNTDYGLWF